MTERFVYPKTPDDPGYRDFETVHGLHGVGAEAGLSSTFGQGPIAPAPWPRGRRSKTKPPYDRARVQEGLQGEQHLTEVDPRFLHATQPNIRRDAASYYAEGDDYEKLGRTFADQGSSGNRHPVVYQHEETGQNLLLSGHHRAYSALVNGRGLRARIIGPPDA